MRFSKLEWEKIVIRSGNAFPFMNLPVTPGGHRAQNDMFFTVKNSRVQSISQELHFSMF